MNEKFGQILKKLKNAKVITAAGLIGIALIFLSSLLPSKTSKTENKPTDYGEYQQNLQSEITALVKKISGCSAKVVITLDSGYTYNYADEKKSANDTKSTASASEQSDSIESKKTVITDAAGNEQAIVINEYLPQVRGVAVVYYGIEDERINEKISAALKAALSITSKQIFITGNGG